MEIVNLLLTGSITSRNLKNLKTKLNNKNVVHLETEDILFYSKNNYIIILLKYNLLNICIFWLALEQFFRPLDLYVM